MRCKKIRMEIKEKGMSIIKYGNSKFRQREVSLDL